LYDMSTREGKNIKALYSHSITYRVCYADTDLMGFMYYGNYARLYEIGRVEAIRNLGLEYREMEEIDGIILPVVALQARFIKPALYDDLLRVTTSLPELPGKMIRFENEVFDSHGRCIHSAEVKLFFVDKHTGQRISCPEKLLEKLKPFYDATKTE